MATHRRTGRDCIGVADLVRVQASADPVILRLPVVETFGPTIQGEGPYAGRNAEFIRLGGCNLNCNWCDTPYSWDGHRYNLRAEITPTPVAELIEGVTHRSGIVVLTGGEPMLYAKTSAFHALLGGITAVGRPIHVETNGTILPPVSVIEQVAVFVVSPKLANAAVNTEDGSSQLADGWDQVSEAAEVYLKVVCEDRTDVYEAADLAMRSGIGLERLWVMPQAQDAATLIQRWPEIADAAVAAGANASSRLHLLAWGDQRGR